MTAYERLLDHALAYARAGLAVFPLAPRTKDPLRKSHAIHDATLDPEQIAAWWRENPNYNIGLRPNAGMVVLDEDPRHGGDVALARLCAERGPLPTTWTARTGSGGRHIWLRAAGSRFRRELCPGVDIKSHAGYLVAPPSIHPCGRRYAWLNKRPIAYAPAWMPPMLEPPPPPPPWSVTYRGNGDALVRFVAGTAEGNRNNALYWAACRAVTEGTFDRLRDDLRDAARAAGLDEPGIESALRSAARNHRDTG